MATFLEGAPDAASCRFAVAVARFHGDITEALLDGCLRTLEARGVPAEGVEVTRVPGAFELPVACEALARRHRYDALIALGCVVRGETPHFDFVAGECARGVMDVGLRHGVPAILGVLTTDTLAQARHRASRAALGGSAPAAGAAEKRTPESNKGAEAALAALEMAGVLRAVEGAG